MLGSYDVRLFHPAWRCVVHRHDFTAELHATTLWLSRTRYIILVLAPDLFFWLT